MPYNSTIRVKKKKCVECGSMAYIFSKGRCEQCARVGNHKALLAKDEDTEDAESVAILKKDADILFSRLVRLRAADTVGLLNCYICNVSIHYTHAHAMHYTHREDSSLRYHPKNVRSGCVSCNVYKDGNLKEYADKLDAEEKDLSEWLYLEGKQPYKFSRNELKQMIADFSREIRLLQKTKNLK
jgi:NinG protein